MDKKMFRYMNYGPYICIGVVLAILFVLWAFWGGKNYEFIGLAPLAPDTCGSYTGSVYNWGQTLDDPPTDPNTPNPNPHIHPHSNHHVHPTPDHNITLNANPQFHESYITPQFHEPEVLIDNTPVIPEQFLPELLPQPLPVNVCLNDEIIMESKPQRQQYVGRIVNGTPVFNAQPTSSNAQPTSSNIRPASSYNLPPTSSSAFNLPPRPGHGVTVPSRVRKSRNGKPVSKGERICCETMERIYGVPFDWIWPDWLINPETGERLELDCYNDELQIAVEYNGPQHYKWPNFTNQSETEFINQIRRDELKMQLCDRQGIYLIVVPYNVKYESIPEYIMSHLPETLQKRLQEERTLADIA